MALLHGNMTRIKNKITLLNVCSSLTLQIVTIVSGFIIPKIILSYFGSEVNGLVSSLTQFLSYISLVEGGVSGVITASLYKPLVNKDSDKISSIIKTANGFFKKIGIIFIIYSLAVAILYPMLANTEFSFSFIFLLTLILSLKLLIQYMFSLSLKTLLTADKKVYVVSIIQIILIILNVLLVLVSVRIYPNIHILKLISGLLFILQPIIYSQYVNRHYRINKNVEVDNTLLKQRWNGFAINIAAFIHFSTDVTVLTIFTDLATVSIYSVYALVTTGLRSIINSISSGISPTIGQAYARGNEEELIEKINMYEYITDMLVFYFFGIASLLITPFVMIYTNGVNDANYYQPLFGVLLLVSEALYLLKLPHLNLAYSANKFKDITIPGFIEAILNILISVVLVRKIGLIGIACGTIVGMLYRLIFHVHYTKRFVKKYKTSSYYSKVLVFLLATSIGIAICYYFLPISNYMLSSWIINGFIYCIIIGIIYFIISILFYKKEFKSLIKYIKK